MKTYRKPFFLGCIFAMLAAPAVHGGLVEPISKPVASSEIDSSVSQDTRLAEYLWVTSGTGTLRGLNQRTAIFNRGTDWGTNGWTSGTTGVSREWVAFEFNGTEDIQSMFVWNAGVTNTGGNGRDVTSFGVYIPLSDTWTPSSGATVASNPELFKYVDTLSVIPGQYMEAQYYDIDIPQGAKWVILSDFTNVGGTGDTRVSMGKVAFSDTTLDVHTGFSPTKVAGYSYVDEGTNTNRSYENLITLAGLANNPFVDSGQAYYYSTADQTSWMSKNNGVWDAGRNTYDVSKEWLAFNLGDTYDLDGMLVWNYAQYGDTTYDETSRGVQDFDLYLITEADVAKLASLGYNNFDSLFINGRDVNDLIAILTGTDVGLTGDSYTLEKAELDTGVAEQELVRFSADNVVWAFMHLQTNFGEHEGYVGLGQVQFLEGSGSSDSAVPEPAAWAMLLMGAMGLLGIGKRFRKGRDTVAL